MSLIRKAWRRLVRLMEELEYVPRSEVRALAAAQIKLECMDQPKSLCPACECHPHKRKEEDEEVIEFYPLFNLGKDRSGDGTMILGKAKVRCVKCRGVSIVGAFRGYDSIGNVIYGKK